jgi:large subunit ribosomal protein L17
MRHGKKHNHLGRTTSHRRAMLANMASSLIEHKRITTTLAKAKALRVYVEPILTKGKSDNTHSRRAVFSYLQSKDAVTELFRDIAVKIANRPGGYTRIIKLENRLGDNAEMAIIELVDYNTVYGQETAAPAKKATRRRGGAGTKAAAPAETVVAETAAPAVEEAPATPAAEEASAKEDEAEKGE